VGKSVSARDMLQAGRAPSTGRLDNQSPTPTPMVPNLPSTALPRTEQLVDSTTSRQDARVTSHSNVQLSGDSSDWTTRPLGVESPTQVTYQRATVFLTPEQRGWLKQTAKGMPVDGLSASDVVRLALNELRRLVGEGSIDLVSALTKQAHQEAVILTGRRNRGLPPSS